jgi:cobalt-zinc-cadmium efflux system protein
VVVAALVIGRTGWYWLDPALSLAIVAVIVLGTWSLMKESLNLILDAVPEGVNPDDVESYLRGIPGVKELHDLHGRPPILPGRFDAGRHLA